MRMQVMKSRYYSKILIQILAIALIPTIVIGMVLGIRLYISSSQRMAQIETLAMRQTVSKVEEQLKGIQHSMLQFYVQQDAVRNENLINDFQSYNRLTNATTSLMLSHYTGLRVEGVFVIGSKNNWIYDTDTGYRTLQSENDIRTISQNVKDGWSIEKRYIKNNYFHLESAGDVLTRYLSFPDRGVVAVKINYDNFCSSFDPYSPVSTIYILNSDGTIIYDGTRKNLNMSADNQPFYSQLSGDQGTLKFERDGVSYTGFYLKSPEFDWTYISIKEAALTQNELLGNMTMMFLLSLLIMAAAVFFVTLLSRRLYKPVYNLYQNLGFAVDDESQGKEKSRFDELKMIEHSVIRLIGDNSRLQKQISDQRELTRELMIYKLFTGHISSENDYNMLYSYNIRLSWENKALIGIQFAVNVQESDSQYQEIYFVGIQKIIKDILPENTLVAPIMIDNTIIFILGKDEDDFQSFAEESIQLIYQNIVTHLQVEIRMALSKPFSKINRISSEFDRIKRLLSYHNHSDKNLIIPDETVAHIHYPDQASEDIIKGIKVGDMHAVQEALSTFMKNVYLHITDGYQQQLLMIWLLGDILRLAPDYSGHIVNSAASSSQEDLIQTLAAIDPLEDKEKWLIKYIIKPVIELLHTNDANKLFLVKRMLSFISDNPQSAGDIEACATFLNYNSSYLRKIFKDKMGVSYGQYSANFILEKAKSMLVASDLPVSTIAQELGYSNSQNFIRYFKKEAGMTPGQYRSEHK